MAEVGDPAPDFILRGVDGARIDTFALNRQLRRSEFVVLCFYVYDFSPVCTAQVCELDGLGPFEAVDDVTLWGIGRDGPYAHREFIARHDISVPLLCDTAERVAEAYDVLSEEQDGFARVPRRSLFLVDDDFRVRVRWVAADNWDEWTPEPFDEIRDAIEGRRAPD